MVDGTETDLVFHSDGDGTIHGIMDIMVGVGVGIDLTMVDIMEVTTVGITVGVTVTDIQVITDMDTIVQEEFILNQVTETVVV